MNHIFKTIHIDNIVVNILNPRYEPQEDELKEMVLILESGKINALIKDISIYGLDPSENLIVTYDEEVGAFIADEGNRRITAVKLFNNPEVIPNFIQNREKFINNINKIKEDSQINNIQYVNCVIIDSEDTKNHFIELKHTGLNGGAGRLKWDTDSQYRFQSGDEYKKYLISFLKEIYPNLPQNFGLTTIDTRILSDPDIRKAIGITLDKKKPEIRLENELSKAKIRFIIKGLLLKNFNVNTFRNKGDRLNFIEQYLSNPDNFINEYNNNIESTEAQLVFDLEDKEIITTPEKKEKQNSTQNTQQININSSIIDSIKPDNGISTEDKPTENSTNSKDTEVTKKVSNKQTDMKRQYEKRQTQPIKREYPFKGINFNGNNFGISQSLFELHNINIKLFKLASTILFRTLFECTLQEYILAMEIDIKTKKHAHIKSLSLDSLLQAIVEPSNGNFKELEKANREVARILKEANQKRDSDELNTVAHGNLREPSVEALWDIERRWYYAIKIMINDINRVQQEM